MTRSPPKPPPTDWRRAALLSLELAGLSPAQLERAARLSDDDLAALVRERLPRGP